MAVVTQILRSAIPFENVWSINIAVIVDKYVYDNLGIMRDLLQ